jgi:hypothetical protein
MTMNPFIWFMPVAFGAPLFFAVSFPDSYHPNLSSLLSIQNLFFVGIFGSLVLAPDRFQFGTNTASVSGTEFLLTRAIDRSLLFRSRSVFFYILVLLIPFITVGRSFEKPDLKVTEYSKPAQELCISHVAGSTLEPDPSGNTSPLIVIPRGNGLVEKWHFWMFIISALGVQALVLLVYPLKYRLWIFYGIFMSFIFVPDLVDLHHASAGTPTDTERLFFSFAAHQTLFWILTGLALVLAQLFSERRFAQLEH